MNVESSFYGYQEWQSLPSPNVTPQTERILSFPQTSPRTSQLNDIFWTPNEAPAHTFNDSAAMSAPSTRRSGVKRNSSGRQLGQDFMNGSPSKKGQVQSEAASFPTSSFIQQFENTGMDDSSASYIRTPPPTRDQSSKRRSQQQIRWRTPSTIASRQVSTPSDAWLKRADARVDSSPLNFHTPSEFPGVDFTSFPAATEPTTAPVHSSNDLFWDPNSDFHSSFSPAPTLYDDPFSTAPEPQLNTPFMQSISQGDVTPRHSSTRPLQPQTPNPEFNKYHGVDPSMLFTNQPPPLLRTQSTSALAQSSLVSGKSGSKTLRVTRPRRDDSASAAGSLKRTSSDARSREAMTTRSQRLSNASSRDYADSVVSFGSQSHIPRRSSPLKRSHTDIAARYRKSVELVVDQNGTAKTIVKMVPVPQPRCSEDDDIDDIMNDRPLCNQESAQDALREIVAERRRARNSGFF